MKLEEVMMGKAMGKTVKVTMGKLTALMERQMKEETLEDAAARTVEVTMGMMMMVLTKTASLVVLRPWCWRLSIAKD